MKIETLHIRKHAGPADASGHPYIDVNILYDPCDIDAHSETISRLHTNPRGPDTHGLQQQLHRIPAPLH